MREATRYPLMHKACCGTQYGHPEEAYLPSLTMTVVFSDGREKREMLSPCRAEKPKSSWEDAR